MLKYLKIFPFSKPKKRILGIGEQVFLCKMPLIIITFHKKNFDFKYIDFEGPNSSESTRGHQVLYGPCLYLRRNYMLHMTTNY